MTSLDEQIVEVEEMLRQSEHLSDEKTVSDIQVQAVPETSPFGRFYALLGPLNPL
jgi:hypothetical protein